MAIIPINIEDEEIEEQEENRIILKGSIPRTIPQTEGEWAEYHEYIKDSRIHRCEGLIDPRGIF